MGAPYWQSHQIYNYWINVALKKNHLGQMMKELIEEATRWDLEPMPASLWWSNTYAEENKEDMMIKTKKRQNKFPFEKSFNIHGYMSTRLVRKSQAISEERIQKTNKT